MPKPTFFNLDAPKRTRIMDAALHEFAAHEYSDANLDRIAAAAKVPKGSLYQYFATKEEFYLHTVRCALDEAWTFFLDWVERTEPRDCYDLLEQALLHMVALKQQLPHHATIYARVVFGRDTHARSRLYPKYLEHSDEFHDRVYSWGLETGEIDASLPRHTIRFQVNALGAQFQQFVLIGECPSWIPDRERDVKRFARRVVEMHRRSFEPRNRRSQA